jgi:copper resistance protein C
VIGVADVNGAGTPSTIVPASVTDGWARPGTPGPRHHRVTAYRLRGMSNVRFPTGRLGLGLTLASVTLLLVPGVALGHAELETATPADGSTVSEPVTEVIGTYSAAMLPDRSRLVVRDADGSVVARGGVDPDDDTRMVAIPDSPLGDGEYEVQSVATATDGDLERETWTFTVAVLATPTPTASASPTATATATATATPSISPGATPVPATSAPTAVPAPTPNPSADGSAASGTSDVILPIIIALVILGVGAAYLLTRRSRPSDPT